MGTFLKLKRLITDAVKLRLSGVRFSYACGLEKPFEVIPFVRFHHFV